MAVSGSSTRPSRGDDSTSSALDASTTPGDGAVTRAGSKPKKEPEVSTGPGADWELAYVYAFLLKFTDLIDPDHQDFHSVMALEQALLDCSPAYPEQFSAPPLETPLSSLPAPTKKDLAMGKKPAAPKKDARKDRDHSPASSLSSLTASEDAHDPANGHGHGHNGVYDFTDPFELVNASAPVFRATAEPVDPFPPVRDPENPTPVPEHSEAIKTVMTTLIEILSQLKELTDYHGKKTWFHFLINFVTNRIQTWGFGGFRWQGNLLRTRGLKPGQENEQNFWLLRWEDKVHLMRQMVDYILTNTDIRNRVKSDYDLGNQRIAKRDPSSNPLVILPLGRTSSLLTIYHLDTSPRLYASGSPYKADAPWVVVASTLAGYEAFIESLAEPSKADRKKVALKGPFAKAAATAGPFAAAGGKGKGKGKGMQLEDEDGKEEERVLRARLEARLEDVRAWEESQEALRQRAERAAERAAQRDARTARHLAGLLSTGGATTRASRLRSRGGAEQGNGRPDYDERDDDADEEAGGRRKRRRVGDEDYAFGLDAEGADDSRAASEAGESTASGGRRRGGGRQLPPAIPGERRSGRLQMKEEGGSAAPTPAAEDEEDDEEEEVEAKEEEANGVKEETVQETPAAALEVSGTGEQPEPVIDAEAQLAPSIPVPAADIEEKPMEVDVDGANGQANGEAVEAQ
ncbi:hypothetical protein JCM8097_001356 [Rhodosporidiobolus ruineniae]